MSSHFEKSVIAPVKWSMPLSSISFIYLSVQIKFNIKIDRSATRGVWWKYGCRVLA